MARAKCYHTMDAFVKLVVVLVRYSGDASNTVTKVNLLNKVCYIACVSPWVHGEEGGRVEGGGGDGELEREEQGIGERGTGN